MYSRMTTAFAVLLTCACPLSASAQEDEFALLDQAFHKPTEEDLENVREAFHTVDLDQKVLDRYAYRCEAFYDDGDQPEFFVSVHAVDRQRDAVRHVVKRSFTDDNDPRLLISPPNDRGYTDSRIAKSVIPIFHDRLRLEDKIHVTPDQEPLPVDRISFYGGDRNFNPVTCSLMPLSGFFNGGLSKRSLGSVFDIDRMEPAEICVVGTKFTTRTRVRDRNGNDMAYVALMEFTDGLPTTY